MASLTNCGEAVESPCQPTRNTFAKPRPPAPAAAQPVGARAALGPFGNPVIGSITAAGFFRRLRRSAGLADRQSEGRRAGGAPVARPDRRHQRAARLARGAAQRADRRSALRRRDRGSSPPARLTIRGNPNGAAIITISDDAKLEGGPLAAGGGLPPAPIAGLFVQGPGGPLPIDRPGRPDAGPGLRAALRRRRQAARRPDHRRPRPQRQGDPRGDRRACRRRSPFRSCPTPRACRAGSTWPAPPATRCCSRRRWSRRTIRTTIPAPTR